MRKLVVATALVLCLAPAAGASAAAPREFYGVVGGKFDPTAADFDRMGAGRVGAIRINLAWATVQRFGPGRPLRLEPLRPRDRGRGRERDQGAADDLRDAGLGRRAAEPPAHQRAHGRIRGVHTGRGRALRAERDLLGAQPAGPEGADHGLAALQRAQLPDLLAAEAEGEAVQAVPGGGQPSHQAASIPNARIILAGLFPTPQIKNGVTLDKYLTDLYRLKAKSLFDAVALHPYRPTPGEGARRDQGPARADEAGSRTGARRSG